MIRLLQDLSMFLGTKSQLLSRAHEVRHDLEEPKQANWNSGNEAAWESKLKRPVDEVQ